MDNLIKELADLLGASSARLALAAKPFVPITDPDTNLTPGANVDAKNRIVKLLAEIPDDEIDAVLVCVLRKGQNRWCDGCQDEHTMTESVLAGVGDTAVLIAMADCAIQDMTQHMRENPDPDKASIPEFFTRKEAKPN